MKRHTSNCDDLCYLQQVAKGRQALLSVIDGNPRVPRWARVLAALLINIGCAAIEKCLG